VPGSLVDRLNRMKSIGATPGISKPIDRRTRVLDLPGWQRVGEFCYTRTVVEPCPVPDVVASRLLASERLDTSALCFFDTETTGLSSGAGSIVFLFGSGICRGGVISVRQVFLADYPGEPEFLEYVRESIPDGVALVSYNGSSFDLPMLRTRFAMSGMRFPVPDHLDLLHVARRFWQRNLDSCTLSAIERDVLKRPRETDVPGAEVPEIYFEYLRSGDSLLLEPVFEHHRRDIVSLAELYGVCEAALDDPAGSDIDHYRVGAWLLSLDDERGLSVLELAYRNGESRAGLALAVAYRRRGEIESALEVWNEIWHRSHDLEAGVELAKHYEHRERRYAEARAIVESMLTDPRSRSLSPRRATSRSALSHRKARLVRKEQAKGATADDARRQ